MAFRPEFQTRRNRMIEAGFSRVACSRGNPTATLLEFQINEQINDYHASRRSSSRLKIPRTDGARAEETGSLKDSSRNANGSIARARVHKALCRTPPRPSCPSAATLTTSREQNPDLIHRLVIISRAPSKRDCHSSRVLFSP